MLGMQISVTTMKHEQMKNNKNNIIVMFIIINNVIEINKQLNNFCYCRSQGVIHEMPETFI